ncbi:MAG: flagellar biosynthesis protein FlhB [Bdellovibrionales bacterium]
MAEQDQDQKTEQPTSKRLDEAREKGQLPISREIAAWMSFAGIVLIVAGLSQGVEKNVAMFLRSFIEYPHAIRLDIAGLQNLLFVSVVRITVGVGICFAVMIVAAVAGIMLQTGFFASTALLKPDFARLSPMNGIKRLISMNALVELLKSFVKLVVLGFATYVTLKPLIYKMETLPGVPLLNSMALLQEEAVDILILLLVVFTFVAVGDLLYKRYEYMKNLRMTKTEVKDEFKQQEGDPVVKGRLRQIRMEKARKRMMAQVPKADVVITNPTHYAIALQYDNTKMAAPILLAKGVDQVAVRIRELAQESNVPLVSNPPLARVLYETVDLDESIPPQHYRAVAEIISYVYKLKRKRM